MSDSSSSRSVIGFAVRIRNLDADRGLARDAIDQHRLGLHREAQVVGEAGDAAVLHAGVGLELVGRDDRAGVDLDDLCPRRRTRGTSLRAGAPRPSARVRRSCAGPSARRAASPAAACSRPCGARPAPSRCRHRRAGATAASDGACDRRIAGGFAAVAAADAAAASVVLVLVVVRRRIARARRLERRGGVGGLGRDLRRVLAAGLLHVLLDDLLALAIAAPLLAPLAPAGEQARRWPRTRSAIALTAWPNENCVDENHRERQQRRAAESPRPCDSGTPTARPPSMRRARRPGRNGRGSCRTRSNASASSPADADHEQAAPRRASCSARRRRCTRSSASRRTPSTTGRRYAA